MGRADEVRAEQAHVTAAYERLGLEDAPAGLCFGRLDRVDGSTIHVGRRGVRADGEPLIVDWRAEAARPFYAATAGHPMGLQRRRHVAMDGRVVVGVADEILDGSPAGPGDVPGDGPLAEVLSAPRTGRMGAAVTTLQAEQDAVVRSPHRGTVVVQGGPGTGKTVVALHRAAYVLFAFPAAARNVLVVGPDRRFLEYISRVLPALGEHGVQLVARRELAGLPDREDPPGVARRKGVARVRVPRPRARPMTLPVGDERVTVGRRVVADALAAARDLPYHPGRAVFKERLIAVLAQRRIGRELDRIDAETAALVGIDLDRAVAEDLRALGLAPGAREELDDPAAVAAALRHDAALDAAVDEVWPVLTPAGAARIGRTRSSGDLVLLDEAAALVDGVLAPAYGHIVVDEAQELTEAEWRLLLRRCPSRSMTVAGDFAQAGPVSTVRSWAQVLGPRFELHTLTVNYRTTAEILAATGGLLAEIAPDQVPGRSVRHGEAPRHLTGDLVRTVAGELRAQEAAHPGELRAVICPDALAGRLPVTRTAQIVPISQARGLEFDSVLVVAPEQLGGPRERYVAMTRATRRLCVVHRG